VGKFGVSGTNPALFCLLREGIAGPLLLLTAFAATGSALPPWEDVARICAAGFGLFSNQLFFMLGLKLSDPVSGSAWQPSQPIFTMVLAICVGYEQASCRRAAGVLVAVAGAVFMVLMGSGGSGESGSTQLLGHIFFCLNCVGTSAYVIISKALVRKHPPILVTSWSYVVASAMMLVSVVIINSSPWCLQLFCDDKDPVVAAACADRPWHVPGAMVMPLVYWILGNSMLAYGALTWANRFAKASVVSAYTVLQPATSGTLSMLLILANGEAWGDKYGLEAPGIQDLGLLGIVLGLAILFSVPTSDGFVGGARASSSGHGRPLMGGGACQDPAA